jgi:predicted ATPase
MLCSILPDNALVIIDEPDMSLSIRSIHKLHKILAKTKQIICSVHNPLLVSYVEEVLSLEHSKWMSSQEFITLSKE